MSVMLVEGNDGVSRLVFDGKITCDSTRELEERIIDTMRVHPRIEVDLSSVVEIDICGIHLIGVMQNMGGANVKIVATSPAVERAFRNLLASQRGAYLGRVARNPAAAPPDRRGESAQPLSA